MRQSVRLGRIAGVPVGAHWSVLVILAVVAVGLSTRILPDAVHGLAPVAAWAVGVPVAAVFLASLLAHEAAHAVVAHRRGMRVHSVTLWMLGGVTELRDEPPSWRTDFAVAAAGPATSLVVAALGLGLAWADAAASGPRVLGVALAWVGWTNLLLAVFNLLPGAPLDGGRLLRALLWWHGGDRARAERASTRAGRVLGTLLAAAGLLWVLWQGSFAGLWLALVGWFLVASAAAEQRADLLRDALHGRTAAEVMTPVTETAPAWSTVESFTHRAAPVGETQVLPVVDIDGHAVGVLVPRMLAAVPTSLRPTTRLDRLAAPARTVAPEDPALDAVPRREPGRTAEAVLVVADGRPVGTVTLREIGAAVHSARAAHHRSF